MSNKHEKASVYSILYWLIQDKVIEPGILFEFLELFWPTFIKKDGYIFSKESFSEEEYNRLINENSNPEYWINLLTIDELFSEMADWEEKANALTKTLVSMWTEKLKKDFSGMNFKVEYFCNEEFGDYGLTFYQTDKDSAYQLSDMPNEISSPNIKESKIEQSSNGPRPGIPKIRKARTNEVPQKG